MSNAGVFPAPVARGYPQREPETVDWLERTARRLGGALRRARPDAGRRLALVARKVREREAALDGASEREFQAAVDAARDALHADGLTPAAMIAGLAVASEAAARALGKRPYDVQRMGAWTMLDGRAAEMATGEGKTLTAALAAGVAGLAGIPVHVVTVNDYLVTRDADDLGPLYARLALEVGTVIGGASRAERKAAYAADVTYCSNKELVFDYLKDRIALGADPGPARLALGRLAARTGAAPDLLLRGLEFAIVDELDSVLIDEARVPCVISRTVDDPAQAEFYRRASALAGALEPGRDFIVDRARRQVALSVAGRQRVHEAEGSAGCGIWGLRHWREQAVVQALTALTLYERDRHYLVRDDKVEIVDEFTGRTMPDRSWELGLHQMIEAKEGVPLTGEREPLARIGYQRFFSRYLRLAGMSGTLREIAPELWSVYRLETVAIPTHRPCRRQREADRVFPDAEAKWAALVARTAQLHRAGRPVLIGTRSVADSEVVSARLTAAGLAHEVLNARQDAREAEIVAVAGEAARITVATNMAGRGTDIRPSPAALAAGGLAVIGTERHEAGRIDRQLVGRTGRQGDPGSTEFLLSLEDELVETHCPAALRSAARHALAGGDGTRATWLFDYTQRRVERAHARMREDLREMDERTGAALAFAGVGE